MLDIREWQSDWPKHSFDVRPQLLPDKHPKIAPADLIYPLPNRRRYKIKRVLWQRFQSKRDLHPNVIQINEDGSEERIKCWTSL